MTELIIRIAKIHPIQYTQTSDKDYCFFCECPVGELGEERHAVNCVHLRALRFLRTHNTD